MSKITSDLDLASNALRQGEIVAIPTETVYGLAGNAENNDAISKIYHLKNRPLTHPLIMHVAQHWDLLRWVKTIPDYAQRLINHFWPGPLTLVLPAQTHRINSLVTGGQSSVAIRCPQHPLAQELLKQLNFPLVAPSANPFGKMSPTTAKHVHYYFKKNNLLIVEGGRCKIGIESTIVDATNPNGYQILRHGSIDEAAIQALLLHNQLSETSTLRVPGKMASHYQPEKPFYCFDSREEMQIFCQQLTMPAFIFSFTKNEYFNHYPGYQLPTTPERLAFEFYFQLHQADQSSASLILMELPPDTSVWQAIRERALKAAFR